MYGYILVENRKLSFAYDTLATALNHLYCECITQFKRLRSAPSEFGLAEVLLCQER